MSVPERAMSLETKASKDLIKLAVEIDRFESYSIPHAQRIAVLANAIATKFNLASHDRETLHQAALVHDIGELAMNRHYIGREGVLNNEEHIDMQRHPVIGEQEAAKRGLPRAVQLIVRWHHEWWNGTGYPDCLEREQIPLAARILRVCDTYSAMTDYRPYSVPISESEAKRYLTEWAGIEFDPKVVMAFLSLEGFDVLISSIDEKANLNEHLTISE